MGGNNKIIIKKEFSFLFLSLTYGGSFQREKRKEDLTFTENLLHDTYYILQKLHFIYPE